MTRLEKVICKLNEAQIRKQTKEKDDLWYFEQPPEFWIKPGQLVNLRFHNMIGKDSFIDFPAIINKVHLYADMTPPTADVIFGNKWNSGEFSGLMKLEEICVWRYFSPITEIPKDFIEALKENSFEISPDEIFYVKSISETERELVYPFRRDLSELKGLKIKGQEEVAEK